MQCQNVDFFGSAATFHHVGLAVVSIDSTRPGLQKFYDPVQKVAVAFMDVHGAAVELVEPADENSPVSASLVKGIRLLHLCYEVPTLEAAIAAAATQGFRAISHPAAAVAFDGRRIVWLYHAQLGLFELLEAVRTPAAG